MISVERAELEYIIETLQEERAVAVAAADGAGDTDSPEFCSAHCENEHQGYDCEKGCIPCGKPNQL